MRQAFLGGKLAFSIIFTAYVRLMVEVTFVKIGQTGLLEYKYREIFVLVLGVICTLLTGVE